MIIGIFGSAKDPQSARLRSALEKLGVGVTLIESKGMQNGVPHSFDGSKYLVAGCDTSDVAAWFLQFISAPIAPVFRQEDRFHLFDDWYVSYMQQQERYAYSLSWLMNLSYQGVPVVNPPECGSLMQMKAVQLRAASVAKIETPRTLVTNDRNAVLKFCETVGKEVVFKPLIGGALCETLNSDACARLQHLGSSPVIFQERIVGMSVRLTFVGSDLVSSVQIPSSAMDYRADEDYQDGKQSYVEITPPAEVIRKCQTLMRMCGLYFSGMDFILQPDGKWIFLEANSSPIYLDVELKTGHPITERLARYLVRLGENPEIYDEPLPEASATESFVRYVNPLSPKTIIGAQ